jgi:hypothetical protein
MFGWLKKQPKQPPDEKIAHQPPGEMFPWAKGWQLTALDEAIIAVPAAILSDNEAIGSVIHTDDGVRLNMPMEPHSMPDALIMLWLLAGQSVWLSKSCDAFVVPQREGDSVLRRFRVSKVS